MNKTADITAVLLVPEPEPAGASLAALVDVVLGRARAGAPIVDAVDTGLELLGEGGIPRGELTVVAGAPGTGKSLLCDRLMLDALLLDPRATCTVFALETSAPIRVARLLAGATVRHDAAPGSVTGVPVGPLMRGTLRDYGLGRIVEAGGELTALCGERMRFRDDARTAQAIADAIVAEAPTLALLDHAGLIEPAPGESGIEAADRATGVLVDAARASGTALVAVAEINKAALGKPTLAIDALRGSARLGSIASVVLILERDDDDDNAASRDPMLRLSLVKHRHAPAGIFQRGQLFGGLSTIRMHAGTAPIARKKPKGRRRAD